ncbi:DUF1269 domain-containing protein [Miltoncostaea oceani]|jgi:uncharacterized membrane protein|uniref:DUF1269 domain-containing protein n=1 Tax=Miltoncostaea oceani TaxID=2843216 RepID=UPI001C3E0D13|nr:DUF1269 domain-containing protein [Miltoncostaea oceani]
MATTLTVWKYRTPAGAEDALAVLEELRSEQLIEIHDAAVVSWSPGAKRPKTRELNSLTGVGALGGAFWGLLFGLVFFIPLLGVAVGAAMGGLAGSLTDVGIDDSFIRKIREEVTPGTSALFLLTSGAVMEKVLDRFQAHERPELIQTNLSDEDEAALRQAFTEQG